MHHAGRILLELLPKLCDEPGRMLRLLLEDGTEKQVMVNQEHVDPATQQQRCYLLAQGTYAVTVDAGPSYERQRQDGVATMADMAKADPKIMAVADDLVVGAMAFPGAKEIAKRLKKTIDPQLLDDDAPDAETRLALAQGQLKQVSEQAQALNAHAGEVEQAHQASMQECQQLQAALDAAKADRQGQVLDDQAKRRELAQRETEDQRQAVLDSRKLDLEAGKLTLEQQKIDLDVQTHLLARATAQETQQQAQHTRQQAVYAQADHDETTEMEAIVKFQEMQDAMGQLQGVPAQLAQIAASLTALQQAEAARCAPKSVQMHRGPDGALVGTVTDPAGKVTRRLALAKAGTGYTGEVA
jgi:hypothetical protein